MIKHLNAFVGLITTVFHKFIVLKLPWM